MGIFLAYTASHIVGALQTMILALKDPWSGGFFANLGRAIARNTREFDETLGQQTANMGDVQGFIEFIMKLPSSYSFRWFKTMVDLGNNSIGQFNKAGLADSGHTKSRIKDPTNPDNFSNPLSNFHKESQYLMPKSFKRAKTLIGDSLPSDLPGKPRFKESITKEEADELERKLDVEYMPFYIRDLRTNEIISFHAFLDSYSDGWTANYSEIKGVGRVEAAPIYDSASRAITFGFTMAAFSPEDMDYMYWKLNKLVTLLYPQWSKGTLMKAAASGGKKSFYMPFSQIPTASPMVRLRIGDILTNNYSDMSAMRLMGIGDDKTISTDDNVPLLSNISSIDNTTPIDNKTNYPALLSPKLLATNKPDEKRKPSFLFVPPPPPGSPNILGIQTNSHQPRIGDTVEFKYASNPNTKGVGVIMIANMISGPTVFTPAVIGEEEVVEGDFTFKKIDVAHIALAEKTVGEVPIDSTWKIVGFSADYDKTVWLQPISHSVPKETSKNLQRDWAKEIKGAFDTKVNKHLSTHYHIKNPVYGIKYEALANYWSSALVGNTADIAVEEADFLVGNPIIRSFENNRGSGIAGFIQSLSIDWGLNNVMWNTDKGTRAPTLIKVTCNFRPIHDITPGLDAEGFNRAPVYKIGKHATDIHSVPDTVQAALKRSKNRFSGE